MYHDPEAIYQDADIEMLELTEAATDPDRGDPWKECHWCYEGNQNMTGEIQIFDGHRTYRAAYCETHKAAAHGERAFYKEAKR